MVLGGVGLKLKYLFKRTLVYIDVRLDWENGITLSSLGLLFLIQCKDRKKRVSSYGPFPMPLCYKMFVREKTNGLGYDAGV